MRAATKAPYLSSRVTPVAIRSFRSLRTQTVCAQQRDVTVAAKGKTRMRQGGGRQQKAMVPPTPPIDPENEQFVIFVRAKVLPRWIPFSVVTGGLQANMLVKAMNGSFGKDFYKKSLINSLGQASAEKDGPVSATVKSIYKEKDKIDKEIRENIPGYKEMKEFEYGFKIRDKEKPGSWLLTDDIYELPPESEIPTGPLAGVKQAFGNMFGQK